MISNRSYIVFHILISQDCANSFSLFKVPNSHFFASKFVRGYAQLLLCRYVEYTLLSNLSTVIFLSFSTLYHIILRFKYQSFSWQERKKNFISFFSIMHATRIVDLVGKKHIQFWFEQDWKIFSNFQIYSR